MQARDKGFTLFELMIALTMVGILIGMAAPSFNNFGGQTRVVTTQNDFVTALNYARGEAVRRGRLVSVCSTTTFTTCDSAAGAFAGGWLAFTDSTGSQQGEFNTGEELLQSWRGPGNGNVSFTSSGTNAHWISFTATGLVSPNTASKTYFVQSVTCTAGQTQRRRITVSPVGSVRTDKVACT
jgi:type IV fimbrial biogenesis protein FimT